MVGDLSAIPMHGRDSWHAREGLVDSMLMREPSVMCEPRDTPATLPTRVGKLQDLDTTQEMPNEAEVHLWTHGDDDEETVCAMLDALEVAEEPEDAKDPHEAFLQRIHRGGAYMEEILDD